MKTSFSILALSVASLTLVACAAPSDEDASADSSQELVNAPVDTHNTWAVGVCAGPVNTDPKAGPLGACLAPASKCTGSLIAPNLVLTARHCVEEIDFSAANSFCEAKFGNALADGKVRITTGDSVIEPTVRWIDVAEVLTEGAANNSCQNDIAILRLAKNVPSRDARPILLDTSPLTGPFQAEKVALVGRGLLTSKYDLSTGTPLNPIDGGHRRRVLTNIPFECVSNDASKPCVVEDFSSPPSNQFTLPTKAYFSFGRGVSSGDSGGAVLRHEAFVRGIPIAIGVTSALTFDADGYGNHGIGLRLDQHGSWIRATMLRHAGGRFSPIAK